MAEVNTYTAFGGRVVFYTRPASLLVSIEYNKLTKLVEGITHDVKELPGAVGDLLYFIASTEQICFEYQGNETPLLTEFRAMWEGLRPYSVESVTAALDWLLRGALSIRDEWGNAVTEKNQLWIDPVEAPKEALTEQQRKELEDPNSPLASSAANAKKKT